MGLIVGIDTGGTFTDVAALDDEGNVHTGKAPTTPADLIDGILAAVVDLGETLGCSDREVLEQTTVFRFSGTAAINAVLTRRGVPTGMIVTKGFEDTTRIGRAMSGWAGLGEEALRHAFRHSKPAPLVPKGLARGVAERIDRDGEVIVALDEQAVADAARELQAAGVEAVAICFLWAVRNDVHERRAREIVEEVAPGPFVSVSSELSTTVGEYERFSTTVINAYVGPPLARTVHELRSRLQDRGFRGELLVAQSDGGCLPPVEVRPAYTMMSGPAGGVIASQRDGQLIGCGNVIATDVGGTSFDVGMVVNGLWLRAENPVVDQMHLSVPMIEVESIGAGGGSIAWVDEGGALNVGPHSAGADPGPAAYGRSGTLPTLTDADIVLGYVNAEYFLGGKMTLDVDAARRAIETVANPLGMEIEQAAAGIAAIANAKMAALLSQRVLARGFDPRDFVVFAYGGAGAMHAAMYAAELHVGKVVVPALAGAFSAVGVSTAPLLHQAASHEFAPMPMDQEPFREGLTRLARRVRERLAANGVAAEDQEIVYAVGMRYGMQLHTVRLELPSPEIGPDAVCDAFDERYEQLYGEGSGYADAGRFLTSFHVEGYGHPRTSPRARTELESRDADEALQGTRRVLFDGVAHEASIYRHERMAAGMTMQAPCIVEAPHTTIVIPPGHQAAVDEYLNVHIELPTTAPGSQLAAVAVGEAGL